METRETPVITVKEFGLKIYDTEKDKVSSDAVYVGRPTSYGNPWSDLGKTDKYKTKTRAEAVKRFREYAPKNMGNDARRHLRGKDLSCDCSTEPEHATIVMEIANAVIVSDNTVKGKRK